MFCSFAEAPGRLGRGGLFRRLGGGRLNLLVALVSLSLEVIGAVERVDKGMEEVWLTALVLHNIEARLPHGYERRPADPLKAYCCGRQARNVLD